MSRGQGMLARSAGGAHLARAVPAPLADRRPIRPLRPVTNWRGGAEQWLGGYVSAESLS